MTGGAGNDTYTVDDAGDVVVEGANAGDDLVQARIATYTLTANVEDLTFLGAGNSVDTNTFTLEDIDTTAYPAFTGGQFIPITAWATLAKSTSLAEGGGEGDDSGRRCARITTRRSPFGAPCGAEMAWRPRQCELRG